MTKEINTKSPHQITLELEESFILLNMELNKDVNNKKADEDEKKYKTNDKLKKTFNTGIAVASTFLQSVLPAAGFFYQGLTAAPENSIFDLAGKVHSPLHDMIGRVHYEGLREQYRTQAALHEGFSSGYNGTLERVDQFSRKMLDMGDSNESKFWDAMIAAVRQMS